ncbi:GNAT family N-acetyltransferase [Gammaproteobacteria bacterium]|nr:GNAT family N-acetyltransferase [Gammaproteobacteria bacterium]MDC0437311.1 GNAT family N-acetyltransferase [Gammaproteobacteria bacterium]MDC1161534.1 GNAT family N-acetyltransferase [Gammaproteobacteria bacterium]MDC1164305.1 GNAT family N-acetyltransferase [Gammaproteobacteria bacterium]
MKEFTHRIATYEDIPTIKVLMELSINRLLGPLLSVEQLEASFDSMGLDDQLIKDGTYFMIFYDEVFVGCGGWSNRETLFGGNHTPNRDDNFLDPLKDSARIRAMYTHPDWARQGIGSLVMHLGENAAKELGFKKCELMATQSGKLLYETQGYESIEDILYKTETGKTVPMIRMEKII